MKSFIVIGLGRFGSNLARELCAQGNEVLALDDHSELVQQISDDVTYAVVGDSRDKEVLKSLGVRDMDCAIVAIGGDLTTSVLTAMNLMELGVKEVVCKAHDEMHRKVLEKLGVNHVIIPEQEQALRLAKSLGSQNMLEYIELSKDYSIIEITAPNVWCDKSIKELNLRPKYGINVIAVSANGNISVSPSGDYVIRQGDTIMVLGDNKSLKAVQKL